MSERSRNITFACALVFAFGLVPLILPEYYVSLATRALILAILAMSVNLLLGYLGLSSMGQGAFFGISAYTVAIMTRYIEGAVWSAMGLGLLTAVLVGAFFGLLAIRTRDVFFVVITLAFGQVLYGFAYSWRSVTGGDDGLPGLLRPELFPGLSLKQTVPYYIFVVIVFLLLSAGFWLLVNSPFGLTLKGIRDSKSRMEVLGYNVWLYKYLAFMISALIGGVSGVLYAYYDCCPTPKDFGVILSSTALLMVILGSPGTLAGPVVGSIIIVFLEDLVSSLTERWVMVLGSIYVIVVLGLPEGILGTLRRTIQTARISKTARGLGKEEPKCPGNSGI